MRTKTLIIASAALAVGILTSSAQTYSQNIVGYVSQTLPYTGSAASSHGWANVCTPLDLAAGNSLTNLFPNPAPGGPGTGPLDFDLVYVWNGNGYTEYTLDSDYASGVGNGQDADTIEPYAPNIAPGTLVYLLNNGGNVSVPTTNVLAGTVHVDAAPTGSQTVGTTTTVLHLGLNYVASKLPIGGGLNSVLQLEVGATGGTGQLDFSTVLIPNIVNGRRAIVEPVGKRGNLVPRASFGNLLKCPVYIAYGLLRINHGFAIHGKYILKNTMSGRVSRAQVKGSIIIQDCFLFFSAFHDKV